MKRMEKINEIERREEGMLEGMTEQGKRRMWIRIKKVRNTKESGECQ